MKQQLISFLGELWMSDVERIEDSNVTNKPAIAVYPEGNFFTQGFLMTLAKFADNNDYRYYIDAIGGELRMRIFKDVKS